MYKKIYKSIFLAVALFALGAGQAMAECNGSSKSACSLSKSCTWVSGYTKKDGTKVRGYCRTNSKSGDSKSSDKKSSDKKSKDKDSKDKKSKDKKSNDKKSKDKKDKKSKDKKDSKSKDKKSKDK